MRQTAALGHLCSVVSRATAQPTVDAQSGKAVAAALKIQLAKQRRITDAAGARDFGGVAAPRRRFGAALRDERDGSDDGDQGQIHRTHRPRVRG